MIFKTGYRSLMARKQIKSGGLTLWKSLLSGLLSVSVAVAARYITVYLSRSVWAVPQFLHGTEFGLLYIFISVHSLTLLVQMMINTPFTRFPEIMTNRWKLMSGMGLPIIGLINAKITASLWSVLRQYTLGFLMALMCGFFINFQRSVNYLLALFFVGIIWCSVFIMASLMLGVFSKTARSARVRLLVSFFFTHALLAVSGFYSLYESESDRFFDRLHTLFGLNPLSFLSVSAAVFLICYSVTLTAGRAKSSKQTLMPLASFDADISVADEEDEVTATAELAPAKADAPAEISFRALLENQQPQDVPDTPAAFRYALFIPLSAIMTITVGATAALAASNIPALQSLLVRIFGTPLAESFVSQRGTLILGGIAAAFLAVTVIMAITGIREKTRSKREA